MVVELPTTFLLIIVGNMVILSGFLSSEKDSNKLNRLVPLLMGWSSEDWIAEDLNKKTSKQMNLF